MVDYPPQARFREVYDLIDEYIERRYDIPVRIRDVPHPFTGDLTGHEIHVDYGQDIDSAVFIIAHLFGHTVQWNVDARAREIGYKLPDKPSEDELGELAAYEQQGCQYSQQLLHDAGITDLDQWLSDAAACDLAYLMHFYRTGDKKPFRSFWKKGCALIKPLPIPEFHPTEWVSRWQGIVV